MDRKCDKAVILLMFAISLCCSFSALRASLAWCCSEWKGCRLTNRKSTRSREGSERKRGAGAGTHLVNWRTAKAASQWHTAELTLRRSLRSTSCQPSWRRRLSTLEARARTRAKTNRWLSSGNNDRASGVHGAQIVCKIVGELASHSNPS